jgi:3-hydroxyisobutyrate dehydrogenase-like beta-hydroxyacid dehydrogenase
MTRIAVLGLGEAGHLYARGLARAGAEVRGHDPALHIEEVALEDAGVVRVDRLADAVADADLVISLVGARSAEGVAQDAMAASPALYADFNTTAPDVKSRIATLGIRLGVPVADVAVLAPAYRAAERTPLLASGPGAAELARMLHPFGVPVETVDAEAGAAAHLKLLRSVFMKGLAAVVLESLGAAESSGAEAWLRAQIAAELGPDGDALVTRLLSGTYAHAERREHEVRDALAALESAGQPADMTRGTLAWFTRILDARP